MTKKPLKLGNKMKTVTFESSIGRVIMEDTDFGELGDRLNFLELDLIEALRKESDDEQTIELLSAAIEKVRGALADIRNIGQME